MRFLNPIPIIMGLMVFACDDGPVADLAPSCEPIVITDDVAGASDDFSIESVIVTGHSLMMSIKYGGGCGSVLFEVTANNSFMESIPVQSQLVVNFQDNDPCKALLREQYCVDLQPLALAYKAAYQTHSGTILLRIPGHEPLVSYSF